MTSPNPLTSAKPCPFCGSKDLIFYFESEDRLCMLCELCDARGPSFLMPDSVFDILAKVEAIKAWNTRAEEK